MNGIIFGVVIGCVLWVFFNEPFYIGVGIGLGMGIVKLFESINKK